MALPASAERLREAIERDPNVAEYHAELGHVLVGLGQMDEAAASLRRALELNPNNAKALCDLGWILMPQDAAAAVAHLQRAIEIDPQLAVAQLNLGAALFHQGRISDAISHIRAAVVCDPNLAEGYVGLAKCLNYLPGATFGLIAEATRRWARLLHRPAGRPAFSTARCSNRKLRVGYVSGDFRTHPVAHFLENVLAAHDRDQFEVVCYSNNPVDDQTTERVKSLADHWRPITRLTDDDVETLVRRDGIDILIDLSGHTNANRLALFVRKAAPVQCTWLGYWATTGLPEIDYIITDRLIVPPGDESFYAEKPWRMPDSYLCFTPPDIAIIANDLPARRNGHVTFGSCNQLLKLNNAVIGLWSRLLHAVSDARLVLRAADLSSAPATQEITMKFAANGIAEDRLTLLGRAARPEILATYHSIDVALDPFPYGGGTTTVEALWMGVPVVSLHGDRFSGRVSESILTTVGLPDFVVADEAAYIGKAIALAQDVPALADLRTGLRDKVLRSPLCDAPRFTRHLEEAYRRMWRGWCERKENAT